MAFHEANKARISALSCSFGIVKCSVLAISAAVFSAAPAYAMDSASEILAGEKKRLLSLPLRRSYKSNANRFPASTHYAPTGWLNAVRSRCPGVSGGMGHALLDSAKMHKATLRAEAVMIFGDMWFPECESRCMIGFRL